MVKFNRLFKTGYSKPVVHNRKVDVDMDNKIMKKKIEFLLIILVGILFLAGCRLHWGVGVGGAL